MRGLEQPSAKSIALRSLSSLLKKALQLHSHIAQWLNVRD